MRRVIAFLCLLILAGCASQRDFNTLKVQVETLQTRLTTTEAKNAERQRIIDQTLKQQAELQNRYTQMQNQIASLQGSIDQVSASAGLTPGGKGETRISLLEKDVQALKDLLQAKGPGSATPAPAQKSLYDSALEKFKTGRYDEAIQDFKVYLGQNPDPAYTDNAYFWMGEALYALGKYDDAILSYDTVVKKHKDSEKLPDALYKEGLAFMKMGDQETGELILQQLVNDYPKTDAALKAKKALKNPPVKKG
jgi:tol-pal system protein YbgF